MKPSVKVISDFNASMLQGLVANKSQNTISTQIGAIGQVYQELLSASNQSEFSLVWTCAEGVLSQFRTALSMQAVSMAELLDEVDEFANALIQHAESVQHCFVASWVMPPHHRGYGILEWTPGVGLAHMLARINIHLAERLCDVANIHLLDSLRWVNAGDKALSSKMWFAAKVPYSNACFWAATDDLLRAITAIQGNSRKLVIVDLDNTLWGGIVGETGWQGLRLGGHDHVGEAFVEFQRALKELTRTGIQLAIASKNEKSVALEAINTHPEMVLKTTDFAAWRINWQDKAQNIAELVTELRLGLHSVVFIDDNPVERERVRSALPEILVPEWPQDPCNYADTLRALGVFDQASISFEDRNRTAMYAVETQRQQLSAVADSLDSHLSSLRTVAELDYLKPANLPRVTQLLNKTNQLNMTTRRLGQRELQAWADHPRRQFITLSISDKFGDLGLTGLLSVSIEEKNAQLIDFVLSCRVMGRNIEPLMLLLAVRASRQLGADNLSATYRPTERNTPTLNVLRASSFKEDKDMIFTWDCKFEYPMPNAITLVDSRVAA